MKIRNDLFEIRISLEMRIFGHKKKNIKKYSFIILCSSMLTAAPAAVNILLHSIYTIPTKGIVYSIYTIPFVGIVLPHTVQRWYHWYSSLYCMWNFSTIAALDWPWSSDPGTPLPVRYFTFPSAVFEHCHASA